MKNKKIKKIIPDVEEDEDYESEEANFTLFSNESKEIIDDKDFDELDDELEEVENYDELEEEEENNESNEEEEDEEEEEEDDISISSYVDENGNIHLSYLQMDNFKKLLKGEIPDYFNEDGEEYITIYKEQIEEIGINIESKTKPFFKSVIIDINDLSLLDNNYDEEEIEEGTFEETDNERSNATERKDLDFQTKVKSDPETCIKQMENILLDVLKRKYTKKKIENLEPFFIRIKNDKSSIKGFEKINSEKLETFVEVRGIIENIGDIQNKKLIDVYYCKKCNEIKTVDQDIDNQNKAPDKCMSQECRGKTSVKEWKPLKKLSKSIDFIHCIIREETNEQNGKKIDVFITGDAVNVPKLGRNVIATGILHGVDFGHKYWEDSETVPLKRKNLWVSYIKSIPKTDFYEDEYKFTEDDFYDKVSIVENDVRYFGDERDHNKPLYIDNKDYYINAIIPRIFEKRKDWKKEFIENLIPGITVKFDKDLYNFKDGLRLWLVQGVDYIYPDGQVKRGTIHFLAVGEPGVAKTKLAKGSVSLIDGAKYTTSKGSTGVGITASIVKDEFTKTMSIKAGALVLAHECGVAIDEFGRFPESHQEMLLEQMEDEIISIDKAGFSSYVFNAKTPIIAVTNPTTKTKNGLTTSTYKINKTLYENLSGITPAILSRFDLKLILFFIDQRNPKFLSNEEMMKNQEKKARTICGHILSKGKDNSNKTDEEICRDVEEEKKKIAFVKQYIKFARKRIEDKKKMYKSLAGIQLMKVDPDTYKLIEDTYIDIIRGDFGSVDRKFADSNRMVESAERLTFADAKFYLQDTVYPYNAEEALTLYKYTIEAATTIYEEDGFSTDPNSQNERYKSYTSIVRDCILDNRSFVNIDILSEYIQKFKKCTPKRSLATKDMVAKQIIYDLVSDGFIEVKKGMYRLSQKGIQILEGMDNTNLYKKLEDSIETGKNFKIPTISSNEKMKKNVKNKVNDQDLDDKEIEDIVLNIKKQYEDEEENE